MWSPRAHPQFLHTLLAAALHRLLHVLRERGPVVTLKGQPPAPHPQGGAAGSRGGARLGARLAPPPTLHPGERLGRLAVGGAALQPVVISHWLSTTRGLCGRSQNAIRPRWLKGEFTQMINIKIKMILLKFREDKVRFVKSDIA